MIVYRKKAMIYKMKKVINIKCKIIIKKKKHFKESILYVRY